MWRPINISDQLFSVLLKVVQDKCEHLYALNKGVSKSKDGCLKEDEGEQRLERQRVAAERAKISLLRTPTTNERERVNELGISDRVLQVSLNWPDLGPTSAQSLESRVLQWLDIQLGQYGIRFYDEPIDEKLQKKLLRKLARRAE